MNWLALIFAAPFIVVLALTVVAVAVAKLAAPLPDYPMETGDEEEETLP